MRRLASIAAILGLATVGVAALPHDANAWWRGGGVGIGIYLPPVILGPPAYYAPPPAYYAPPVYYAPPPTYYAPPRHYWVPAHWEGGYWVGGHWR